MQDACPTSKNGEDEMRHLTPAFALGALHRGKQIEPFLGGIERDGRRGLRWIAVSPGRAGVSVYLSEVEDIGTDTFRDVTEFPPLDPEDESWGKEVGTVESPEEALRLAERELGDDHGRGSVAVKPAFTATGRGVVRMPVVLLVVVVRAEGRLRTPGSSALQSVGRHRHGWRSMWRGSPCWP